MSIAAKYKHKYFFHFTHIDNLDSILANGLLCTNEKKAKGLEHFNIAADSIQERRSTMKVTCGPKGTVHDYVPFYFCSINPMVLSILHTKNVDQSDIIFFAVPVEKILEEGVVFSDASANTDIPPNFYSEAEDLDKLDWTEIGKKSWGKGADAERHKRMAEVLIHKKLLIEDVDAIVVWNKETSSQVQKLLDKYKKTGIEITFSPYKDYYFHFTKFMFKDRDRETIVTGPKDLKHLYHAVIEDIFKKRKTLKPEYPYKDIRDCIEKIDEDFCCINELKGIYGLETKNDVHNENVSGHTLSVVEELEKLPYYKSADEIDKDILKLAAYFHDIGKGPKSKWKDGKQPLYPDHPVDSLKMVHRILIEDIEKITKYEIKMISLLVGYHDLIGEIIHKGRDIQQLFDVIENEDQLNMLSAINLADVAAIELAWKMTYNMRFPGIKKEVLKVIENK